MTASHSSSLMESCSFLAVLDDAGSIHASLTNVVLVDTGSHQMMVTASHNSLLELCSIAAAVIIIVGLAPD